MDIYFKFDSNKIHEPVLAGIILETKVPINIVKVSVSNVGGEALISVPDDTVDLVVSQLKKRGIDVTSHFRRIFLDKGLCVNCGHCVSLCSFDALGLDADLSLEYNEEKCTGCLRCLHACPRVAISI